MNEIREDIPTDAVRALEQGNKIAAIKAVRIAHRVGLKEAKEIVERYIDHNPVLKDHMAAGAESGGLGWLIVIIALVAAAVYFYSGS